MKGDMPLTAIVVDQHDEVCDRLGRALDGLPGIRVLAHTTNLMLAAELVHQHKPDVILADFKWGQAARPDVAGWIGRMSPDSALIVYSSYYINGERQEFEAAGAARCLLKGLTLRELETEISETVAARRTDRTRKSAEDPEESVLPISPKV